MLEFINMMKLEMDMQDRLVEPVNAIQEGEEVIGDLPDYLKKVWTLWQDMGKATDTMKAEMQWGGQVQGPEIVGRLNELAIKTEFVKMMFWIAVKDYFKIWPGDPSHYLKTPGLRAGWKVVWTEADPMSGLPPFLRQIFGG